MADITPADTSAPSPDPAPLEQYTVNRTQDGLQERAELTYDQAVSECAILNAQSRMQVGQTVDGFAIYGSMINGEISRFEVRSSSGLVI